MGKHHAACRPSANQTYLTIGQDLFSIEEYLREQYNYSLHEFTNITSSNGDVVLPSRQSFLPAAFMFYTDIQELRGLDWPTDYGSGIEYADGLPLGVSLQIGLWLNGTAGCRDLIEGRLDAQVQRLFEYIVTSSRTSKVFLRVGYEFDNPDFGYYEDPVVYRQAFRYLRDACYQKFSQKLCSQKIAFVWHSWAASIVAGNSSSLLDFYAGDEYVDWIGISLFSQLYNNITNRSKLGNQATVNTALEFANQHNKPIMIAESTPFGGLDSLNDPWNEWFEPVLSLIEEYDIAMWSYINCNWEAQPIWKGVGFGDTRLSTNATVMQLWQTRVLQNPRFTSTLSCSKHQHGHRNAHHSYAPRDGLWSMGLLDDVANYNYNYNAAGFSSLIPVTIKPQEYWMVAVVLAFMALCFYQVLLSCYRMRSSNGDYEYEPLIDDDDDDDENLQIEHNRTGYGTLEQ